MRALGSWPVLKDVLYEDFPLEFWSPEVVLGVTARADGTDTSDSFASLLLEACVLSAVSSVSRGSAVRALPDPETPDDEGVGCPGVVASSLLESSL